MRPEDTLWAEGVEALECARPEAKRGGSKSFQPDVIVGWKDWERMRGFLSSGWAIPMEPAIGASAPATKWHLRVNLRGGPPVYLNLQLDPRRQRSAITHEAAARARQTYHAFYQMFVRADSGEMRSHVADGADAIVCRDWRRPADPEERGPDVLLDSEDTRHLAGHLRIGWKDGGEFRTKSKFPGSGHWPGRLRPSAPIRDRRCQDREDRGVQRRPRHDGHVRQYPA
jgi:hypothetical protein